MAHGYNVLSIQRTNRRSPQVYVVTRFDCTTLKCIEIFHKIQDSVYKQIFYGKFSLVHWIYADFNKSDLYQP